mmetsp:Transcript_19763/g.36781  ORF Transcript_19763/g.36781 Transcript_19763/m.36781 type:complete len:295 (-) Transcript_19763:255-1139(-)
MLLIVSSDVANPALLERLRERLEEILVVKLFEVVVVGIQFVLAVYQVSALQNQLRQSLANSTGQGSVQIEDDALLLGATLDCTNAAMADDQAELLPLTRTLDVAVQEITLVRAKTCVVHGTVIINSLYCDLIQEVVHHRFGRLVPNSGRLDRSSDNRLRLSIRAALLLLRIARGREQHVLHPPNSLVVEGILVLLLRSRLRPFQQLQALLPIEELPATYPNLVGQRHPCHQPSYLRLPGHKDRIRCARQSALELAVKLGRLRPELFHVGLPDMLHSVLLVRIRVGNPTRRLRHL